MIDNRIRSISVRAAVAACFLIPLCLAGAHAQRKLIIEDKSEVRGVSRGRGISRGPKGSTSVAAATNAMLIVLTDPPGAEIGIDGKPAGKSDADGEFTKELRAGRTYAVKVSAGGEYLPFTTKVSLKPRQPGIVQAALSSKYGLVVIGPAREGGEVFVDGQKAAKALFDKENNVIAVDGLLPGRREIIYEHPDLVPVRKVFEKVESGQSYPWTFQPVPATVELAIRTNAGAGVFVGEMSYCATPDNTPFKVLVRPGTREVRLVKDGYEEFRKTYDFVVGTPVSINETLRPIPEFSDGFDGGLANWVAPKSWSFDAAKRLVVSNSPELGYPKGIDYTNCQIAFQLRLLNDVGAAWAVRAQDPNNYYLFYLSGPRSRYPNTFRTYIVRGGQFNAASPASTADLPIVLARNVDYTVVIKAEGPVITHGITPASTGVTVNIGYFKDPNLNAFTRGGFGFRTVGSEEFTIDDLVAEPIRAQ
jgi:hypothetical protein